MGLWVAGLVGARLLGDCRSCPAHLHEPAAPSFIPAANAEPIPDYPVKMDVRNFGAKADGSGI